MNRYNTARLLTATALAAFASLAHAQYMWIDEKGVKQLSDRGPPSSIPQKNILKAPYGMPTAAMLPQEKPAAAATATAAPSSNELASKPTTLADRNADFRKRAKEKEEREQKDAAEESAKRGKAEDCERARTYKRSLDSGVRVGTTDQSGERGYMSDEQRAAESKKADKALASCK